MGVPPALPCPALQLIMWVYPPPPALHCTCPALQLIEWVYGLLSKLRMPMGKGMDAVLAMRRMKMTSEGIEHCVDDEEECSAEW